MLSQYPSFKKLLTARFLYSLALQMQAVVLGWQMYVLTHKALYLGFIGLAEAIPALSFALFAGYIVDHGKPLKILRIVMALGLFSGIVVCGSQASFFSTNTQIIALFTASFLTGVVRSFFHPSIFAITPQLIPREALSKASAWMTSLYQIASISGPALGGLLFGFIGSLATSVIVCWVLLCALIAAYLIAPLKAQAPKAASTDSLKKELLSGAVFVFKHPILLPALSLDMLAVLFGGVTALLPIFASEILFLGPKGLGLLKAAPAIGASIVGLWLTRVEIKKHAGRWLLSCVSGFGLCILIFALSRSAILSFIALGLSGAFDSVSAVIRGTIVQLAAKDDMRGRISAINMVFISSSNELGEFESGFAATLFGTVPSVVIGSVICLGIVLTVAVKSPKLRQLNISELQ